MPRVDIPAAEPDAERKGRGHRGLFQDWRGAPKGSHASAVFNESIVIVVGKYARSL